jgi:HD-GYP domain-containing protein (c-di-GMP phosphodiesterase class II)
MSSSKATSGYRGGGPGDRGRYGSSPRERVRRLLESGPYTAFIIVVILFTVFAWDVAEGWLASDVDTLLEDLLTGALLIFLLELALMIVAFPRWWTRWSFWIAFVATAAMVLDIPWMSRALFGVTYSAGTVVTNLRLIRIFRMLARVGRLIRVLRSLLESRVRLLLATLMQRRDVQAIRMERMARERISNLSNNRIWQTLETTTTLGITAILAALYIGGVLYIASLGPDASAEGAFAAVTGMEAPVQSGAARRLAGVYPVLYLRIGEQVIADRRNEAGELRPGETARFVETGSEMILDRRSFTQKRARDYTWFTLAVFLAIAAIIFFLNWVISRFSMELSGALKTLTRALDERDPYTRMHSYRVSVFASHIARHLGLSRGEQRLIRIAGELHDIGKIGVPEAILQKPGKLTDEEFDVMKQHTNQGTKILDPLIDLDTIILGVRFHHEKLNGRGYPDGLTDEEIPRIARILAVSDIWDALTSNRPYRDAMSIEKARAIMIESRGTELDADAVDAFFSVWDEIQAELAANEVPPERI